MEKNIKWIDAKQDFLPPKQTRDILCYVGIYLRLKEEYRCEECVIDEEASKKTNERIYKHLCTISIKFYSIVSSHELYESTGWFRSIRYEYIDSCYDYDLPCKSKALVDLKKYNEINPMLITDYIKKYCGEDIYWDYRNITKWIYL